MNKSGVAGQVIRHPQGGGAIKGLGESFSPDLHTGTGNLTVPIAILPGRNKLQPDLSLVYSTGNGNGLFGLGWALSIPGVARDTAKGLPRYSDQEDTFLLSGAEQLVPTRPSSDGAMLYRPRTEGIFARIKHRLSDQDDYWEVRSRNGLKSLYGHPSSLGTDSAAVRNPDAAAVGPIGLGGDHVLFMSLFEQGTVVGVLVVARVDAAGRGKYSDHTG